MHVPARGSLLWFHYIKFHDRPNPPANTHYASCAPTFEGVRPRPARRGGAGGGQHVHNRGARTLLGLLQAGQVSFRQRLHLGGRDGAPRVRRRLVPPGATSTEPHNTRPLPLSFFFLFHMDSENPIYNLRITSPMVARRSPTRPVHIPVGGVRI